MGTIGGTPLVRLSRLYDDIGFEVFGKLEGFNPCGSLKDRTAKSLIDSALSEGRITNRTTIIESSSGNLGIGLAQMCLYYGLHFICVVDPKITSQNLSILRTYGATIEMVSEPDSQTGEYLPARLRRVKSLCESIPDSFWTNQYANADNPKAHWQTMQEVIKELGRPPDQLLCATGSCGTLRGCADYIRHVGARTQIIAVDAVGSVIFNQAPLKRLIPGHGSAVRPALFADGLASRCVHVTDRECVIGCRRLLRREAILAGGSSGAIVSALGLVRHEIQNDSKCVLVLSDRGDRYLDTVFSDEWVRQKLGMPSPHSETPAMEVVASC